MRLSKRWVARPESSKGVALAANQKVENIQKEETQASPKTNKILVLVLARSEGDNA